MLQLDDSAVTAHDSPQVAAADHAPAARSPLSVARKLGRGSLTDSLAGLAPSRKGEGADEQEGVETAGEDQADQVEAAVKQGRSARSALAGGDGAEQDEAEQEGGEHAGAGAPRAAAAPSGPALKRLALKSDPKFGQGFTASRTGLEASGSYELWEAKSIEVPIAAVPGLNALFTPSVTVRVAGGVNWKKKAVKAGFGVEGNVEAGFSYGNTKVAGFYGVMECKAYGGFEYERRSPCDWELDGKIELSTNFKVGVRFGGGIVDYGYEFGKCVLGTLTGISFNSGRLDKGKLGWEWGPKPKEFFAAVKAGIAKAKKQIDRVKKPIKKVVNSGAAAINALTSW